MAWTLAHPPRDWQDKAISSWIQNDHRGIAKVVTGGGKTYFGLMCISHFIVKEPDTRFFIIVPTIALRDQWVLEIQYGLNVPKEEIYSHGMDRKLKDEHRIAVMVINSARTHGNKITSRGKWMLITDECHRAASVENRKAIRGEWAATLGLSATPERQYDEWFEEYLVPSLGPIIAEYEYRQAKIDGVITDFELRNYSVPMTDDEDEAMIAISRSIAIEYRRLEALGLQESPKLMNLLLARSRMSQRLVYRVPLAAKICQQFQGKKIIVFHESIDAADRITEMLDDLGFRVVAYHSKLTPLTRFTNLDFFRSGIKDVLVTCRALDEGLNVPNVEVGIIVASTKSTRQRIQRLGRVLRSTDEKENAVVVTLYSRTERHNLEQEARSFEGVVNVSWYGVAEG
jgi:superfamily II DNA or RNA helicase